MYFASYGDDNTLYTVQKNTSKVRKSLENLKTTDRMV